MRVDPNSGVPRPAGMAPVEAKAKAAAQPDKADLTRLAELNRALENVPEVRAEKVALARALIQDPSYPDEAALGKVADVIAGHFGPGPAEE
jgi:hypothetical protein